MSPDPTAGQKKNDRASSTEGFSPEERAAMKERAAELKAASRSGGGSKKAAADEAAVLAKIAEMPLPDRDIAEQLHNIITTAAPELLPKLWYGQPAYARSGKVVCFFRSGQADKVRYSTFGFNEEANLDDDGGLWPTSFALAQLSEAGAVRVAELVKQAVS
jgi:uncharacterized protein YdhG (YjbR/CyaY superfamily)